MCNGKKMPIDDNYKYVLKYIDDDHAVTSEFSGFVSIADLAHYLRDFLCAAG